MDSKHVSPLTNSTTRANSSVTSTPGQVAQPDEEFKQDLKQAAESNHEINPSKFQQDTVFVPPSIPKHQPRRFIERFMNFTAFLLMSGGLGLGLLRAFILLTVKKDEIEVIGTNIKIAGQTFELASVISLLAAATAYSGIALSNNSKARGYASKIGGFFAKIRDTFRPSDANPAEVQTKNQELLTKAPENTVENLANAETGFLKKLAEGALYLKETWLIKWITNRLKGTPANPPREAKSPVQNEAKKLAPETARTETIQTANEDKTPENIKGRLEDSLTTELPSTRDADRQMLNAELVKLRLVDPSKIIITPVSELEWEALWRRAVN